MKQKQSKSAPTAAAIPTKVEDRTFQAELDGFMSDAPPTNLPPGFTEAPLYDPTKEQDPLVAPVEPQGTIPDPFMDDEAPSPAPAPASPAPEAVPASPVVRTGAKKYDVYEVKQVAAPGNSYPVDVLVYDSSHKTREAAYKRAVTKANARPNKNFMVMRVLDAICVSEKLTRRLERL